MKRPSSASAGAGAGPGLRPSRLDLLERLHPKFRILWLVGIYLLLGLNAAWLLQSPRVGVADNGDYWRVMRPAGIELLPGHRMGGRFVEPFYGVGSPHLLQGGSAPAVLAWLARLAGEADGEVDLRWMGAVYLVLLFLAVTAAWVAGVAPALVALALLVFCDVAYLPFFNSFYADPALFVGLLGLAFWFVWTGTTEPTRRSLPALLSVTVLCFLGGVSKAQYAVLPLVVFLTLATIQVVNRRRPRLLTVAFLVSTGILGVLAPLWFMKGPGPHFPEVNRYHAVYGGLLVLASSPEAALEELEIPPEYWNFPRTDVFSAGIGPDHPVHRALEHVSRLDLLALYLRDPPAVHRAAELVSLQLAAPKSHRRGTREQGHGQYAYSWRWFDLSRWRAELLTRAPWLSLALVATCLVVSMYWIRTRRGAGLGQAALFLSAWAGSQAVVAILGDGTVSLRQHLLGARLGLDLLMVLVTYAVGSATWILLAPKLRAAGGGGTQPAEAARASTSTLPSPRFGRGGARPLQDSSGAMSLASSSSAG